VRVLIDMNLSPRWVDDLKAAGIESQHWSATGRADATDPEILEYAARHGLILLTQDLDFSAILAATGARTPSVMQVRSENLDPRVIAPAVVRALKQLASDLAAGALVSVDPGRTRLTVLPLARPAGGGP
jgi:predicted nuclease of predicted toxin-antitoxin system